MANANWFAIGTHPRCVQPLRPWTVHFLSVSAEYPCRSSDCSRNCLWFDRSFQSIICLFLIVSLSGPNGFPGSLKCLYLDGASNESFVASRVWDFFEKRSGPFGGLRDPHHQFAPKSVCPDCSQAHRLELWPWSATVHLCQPWKREILVSVSQCHRSTRIWDPIGCRETFLW